MLFALLLALLVLLRFVDATVNVHASFPRPFEVSFSDDRHEMCNNPPSPEPRKIVRNSVSLCFDGLEKASEIYLNWRAMSLSFQLENGTARVNVKIRRVDIFSPGASFTMAGGHPVSVFSRLRELEIGTHYNGYGEVSDPNNSSIIFKGQLNRTVFEGHIIYQNLNRSHTIQCFHNNSLEPAFYLDDKCLACAFTTYDSHHNPDSSIGWRSNGHSVCNNKDVDHSFQDQLGTRKTQDLDSRRAESSGFPQTGFSDYITDSRDQNLSDSNINASQLSTAETHESDRSSTSSAFIPAQTGGSKIATQIHGNNTTGHTANGTKHMKKMGAPQGKVIESATETILREADPVLDQIPSKRRQGEKRKRSTMINGAFRPEVPNTRVLKMTDTQSPEKYQTRVIVESFTNIAEKTQKSELLTDSILEIFATIRKSHHTRKPNGMFTRKARFSNRVLDDREKRTTRREKPFSRVPHTRRQRSVWFPLSRDQKPGSAPVLLSTRHAHPSRQYREKRTVYRQNPARAPRSASPNIPQTSRSARSTTPKTSRSARPNTTKTSRLAKSNTTKTSRSARSNTTKTSPSASQPQPLPSNKTYTEMISCPLHLVADHLFFSEIGEKNPAKTVNLMLSVVIGADAVFRAADFDGDGVRDNIGLMVKNITIIHNSSLAFYHYSRTNGNSFEYLKSFSTGDFSDVCLGVAFTAIDFQRGVVGLAWYASSSNSAAGKGGICGQRVYLPNEGSSFSFNTAIVSFLNHGSSVPMERAILTMAHELGHCFGSSHDDMAGSPCNKINPQGSYLMRKYGPSQFLPKNYKFSPCSLRQMYPVITLKGSCLLRYTGPTCGNRVVEDGEECDCGLSGVCQYYDPCCTPGDAPPSSADLPCTIRRSKGLECSPVTFSCCSDSCKPISMVDRFVCREAGACYSSATCDGQSPLCPVSSFLPEGTLCHGGIRTCFQGRCRQSLCARAGLADCFCKDNPEDQCKLCCRRLHDSRCQPADVFNITSALGHVIYLPDGDACLHYRGVCTVSKGGNKEKTFCLTTEDLGGDASALIGLQLGEESGNVTGHNYWFYLIPILLLSGLIPAALLYGRRGRGRFQDILKKENNANPNGKLLAFIAAAHSQSDVFRQEIEQSALCDRMCSRFAFQCQCQQQRQRCAGTSFNINHQHYLRRNGRETTWSNNNERLSKHSFLRHQHGRALSAWKVSFKGRHGQYHFKPCLSLLDSTCPQTLGHFQHNHHKGPRPDLTAFSACYQSRRTEHTKRDNVVFHREKEHVSRHQQVLGSSGSRLRATYCKPSIRTPLQRRRTLSTQVSSKCAMTGTAARNIKAKYSAGRLQRCNPNSRPLSDFTRCQQTMLGPEAVHTPLSPASSGSN